MNKTKIISCDYLICKDPHRPCVLKKGHKGNHRDQAYKESQKTYYKSYDPIYYQNNKDRILARVTAYRVQNPAAKRNQSRRHYLNNPEKYKASNRRRKARIRGAHSEQYTRRTVFGLTAGRCYLCGKLLFIDWHIDHIVPISKGGADTLDNVAPACAFCNLSKGNKSIIEFRKSQTSARQVHRQLSHVVTAPGAHSGCLCGL